MPSVPRLVSKIASASSWILTVTGWLSRALQGAPVMVRLIWTSLFGGSSCFLPLLLF